MNDQFIEVEEILDVLMTSTFLTSEEIDEVSSRFKMVFLTLENKEDFLNFLSNYLGRANENDRFVSERVNFLKFEIDRFCDRIPELFSLYHIGGYADPKDKDESENLSKEIDDSFDFLKNKNLNANSLGLEIKEELKPTITRVLQKISSFQEQKIKNRIDLINKWRLKCIKRKSEIQIIKMNTFQKLSKIEILKSNVFYKLKNLVSHNPSEDSNLMNHNTFQLDFSKNPSDNISHIFEDIKQEPKTNLIKIEKTIRQIGDNKQIEEFLQLKKEFDKQTVLIEQLKEELNSKQSNPNKFLLTNNDNTDTIEEFQKSISELEAKIILLSHENELKEKMMKEQYQLLLETQTAMEKMHSELKKLKIANTVVTSQKIEKIRFLNQLIYKLLNIKLSFAFKSIVRHSNKTATALNNVANRIKARILLQSRALACGEDTRRTFLRWMIKSNPDIIRDSVSKILITSKIRQQVAIWRMKKLIFKPIYSKIPEGVKTIRRLKAHFILTNLMNKNNLNQVKLSFDKMNPFKNTKKIMLLEKIIVKNNLEIQKNNKKHILKKLKQNVNVQKDIFKKLEDSVNRKKELSLLYIIKNNATKISLERISDILSGCLIINKIKQLKQKNFFLYFKKDMKTKQSLSINKIFNLMNKVKNNALTGLIKNNKDHISKEKIKEESNIQLLNKKNFLIKMIKLRIAQKQKIFLNILINNNHIISRLENDKKIKMENIFNQFNKSNSLKQKNALKNLENFNQQENNNKNNVLKSLHFMKSKVLQKKNNGLNILSKSGLQINQLEKIKKLNKNMVIDKLRQNQEKKLFFNLENLKTYVNSQKITEQNLKNLKNKIFDKLSNAYKNKSEDSIESLIKNNKLKLLLLKEQENLKIKSFKKIESNYKIKTLLTINNLNLFQKNCNNLQKRKEFYCNLIKQKLIGNSNLNKKIVLLELKLIFVKNKSLDEKNNLKKNKIVEKIKNNALNKASYFLKLLIKNSEDKKLDQNNTDQIKRNLFGNLALKYNSKKLSVFTNLINNANKSIMNQKIELVQSNYVNLQKNKKIKGIGLLLKNSTLLTMKKVLNTLRNFNNQEKVKTEIKQKNNEHVVRKLEDAVNNKLYNCFNQIINHIKNEINDDLVKKMKLEKIKKMLPISEELNDKNFIIEKLFNHLKKKEINNNPLVNQDIQNILKKIKNVNSSGIYTPLIQKIMNGDFKNENEIKEFILTNNSNGLYDKVSKALGSENMENQIILDIAKQNNSNGKYDNLIKLITNNPNSLRSEIINCLKNNKNDNCEIENYINRVTKVNAAIDQLPKLDESLKNDKILKDFNTVNLQRIIDLIKNDDSPVSNQIRYEIDKEDKQNPILGLYNYLKNNQSSIDDKKLIKFLEENKLPGATYTLSFIQNEYKPENTKKYKTLIDDISPTIINDLKSKLKLDLNNPNDKKIKEAISSESNILQNLIKIKEIDKNAYHRALDIITEANIVENCLEILNKNSGNQKINQDKFVIDFKKNPNFKSLFELVTKTNLKEIKKPLEDVLKLSSVDQNTLLKIKKDFPDLFKNKNLKDIDSLNNLKLFNEIKSLSPDQKNKVFKLLNMTIREPSSIGLDEIFKIGSKNEKSLEIINKISEIKNLNNHKKIDYLISNNHLEEAKNAINSIDFVKNNFSTKIENYIKSSKSELKEEPLSTCNNSNFGKLTDLVNELNKPDDEDKSELKNIVNQTTNRSIFKDCMNYLFTNPENPDCAKLLNDLQLNNVTKLSEFIAILNETKDCPIKTDLESIVNEDFYKNELKQFYNFVKKNNSESVKKFIEDNKNNFSQPKITDLLNYFEENDAKIMKTPLKEPLRVKSLESEEMIFPSNLSNIKSMVINDQWSPVDGKIKKSEKVKNKNFTEGMISCIDKYGADDILEDDSSDILKIIAASRSTNDLSNIFDDPKIKDIKNTKEFADYLAKNNKLNKIDLIFEQMGLKSNLKDEKQKSDGFNILKPIIAKMKFSVKALREHNLNSKKILKDNQTSIMRLLKKREIQLTFEKRIIFNKIVNQKKMAENINTIKQSKIQFLIKSIEKNSNDKCEKVLNIFSLLNQELKNKEKAKKDLLLKIMFKLKQVNETNKFKALNLLTSNNNKIKNSVDSICQKLIKANNNKKKISLDQLTQNSDVIKTKLDQLKKNKLFLLNNLSNKLKSKKKNVFENLSMFIKDTNCLGNIKKNNITGIINKIISNYGFKINYSIKALIDNSKNINMNNKNKTNKISNILQKIDQNNKFNKSKLIDLLKSNSNTSTNFENKNKKLKFNLLKIMKFKLNILKQEGLNKLKDFNKALLIEDIRLKNQKELVVLKLINQITQKKNQSKLSLIKFSLGENNNNLNQLKLKNDKKNIIKLLVDKSNKIKNMALKLLTNFNQNTKKLNEERKNNAIKIFSKLNDNIKLSKKNALENLKNNHQDKINKSKRISDIERNLLKLNGMINSKNKIKSLQTLQEWNKEINFKNKNVSFLIKKLDNNYLLKKNRCLNKLSKFNDVVKSNLTNNTLLNKIIFTKLANSQKLKISSILNNLIKNYKEEKLFENNIKDKTNKIYNKLEANCLNNKKKAFDLIKEFLKNKNDQQINGISKINNLLLKSYSNKKGKALVNLKQNNNIEKSKIDKKIEVVKKLINSNKLKSLSVFDLLHKNIYSYENKKNKTLTITILTLQRINNDNCHRVLNKLKQFNDQITRNHLSTLQKLGSKTKSKLKQVLLELRLYNKLYNRNKYSDAIHTIVKGLKQNHKVCMRQSILIWSQKQMKLKFGIVFDKLSLIVQKHKMDSLNHIKQEFYLKKYQGILTGIMNLVELTEDLQEKRKMDAMKELISQFASINPWFKKIINTMAIYTRPNEQIAFWKIRYSKNLKSEGLSAQMSLNVKKFESIIRKQVLTQLSICFFRITVHN